MWLRIWILVRTLTTLDVLAAILDLLTTRKNIRLCFLSAIQKSLGNYVDVGIWELEHLRSGARKLAWESSSLANKVNFSNTWQSKMLCPEFVTSINSRFLRQVNPPNAGVYGNRKFASLRWVGFKDEKLCAINTPGRESTRVSCFTPFLDIMGIHWSI